MDISKYNLDQLQCRSKKCTLLAIHWDEDTDDDDIYPGAILYRENGTVFNESISRCGKSDLDVKVERPFDIVLKMMRLTGWVNIRHTDVHDTKEKAQSMQDDSVVCCIDLSEFNRGEGL